MCGIAGVISFDKDNKLDEQLVERFAYTLKHRGPDEDGTYFNASEGIALTFKRLSIIDLQTGSQPLSNENNTIQLICNGEIYNFKTLRHELSDKGHKFKTAGDIEPIIHLYEEHSYNFVEYLDGFFALALYDSNKQTLVLAIDRFGKKPIYYTVVNKSLYFASELKALRVILENPQIDTSAVIDYLRFGYIPAPFSIFENVRKIMPGNMLIVRQNYYASLHTFKTPNAKEYYRIAPRKFTGSYSQAIARFKTLTTQAVAKRLIADVPVGVLLSGGLDSSIITAIASRITGQRIRTFSVGFQHERYNELPLARLIAKKYNTEHTELMIDFDLDLDALLDNILHIYDEPFADSSAIPTHKISRIAAKHIKVALTGDGGDEAFMGYDRYRAIMITNAISRILPDSLVHIFKTIIPYPGQELRSMRTRLWRAVSALALPPAEQYSMFVRVFYEHQLASLLTDRMNAIRGLRYDFIAQTFDSFCDVKSSAIRANLTDIITYLPGDLLTKADRASMSASLELRSPFLDYRLMEFCKSLKQSWHIDISKGKKLIRNTFKHLLPSEILSAPKRGFGVPLGVWLRGNLKSQMQSILHSRCKLVEYNFTGADYLLQLQTEHISGEFDNSQRLWALMLLEKFLQKI